MGLSKFWPMPASDRILGVHIIAAAASEMIAEATAIMEFGGLGRRPGPHLSRPPDPYRGRQGGGAGAEASGLFTSRRATGTPISHRCRPGGHRCKLGVGLCIGGEMRLDASSAD